MTVVVEEILPGTLNSINSYEDLLVLSTKAEASHTAKHLVNNLILPAFLMMIFVRDKREGDYALYACTVNEMIPYLLASRHIHYARYGLVYLISM